MDKPRAQPTVRFSAVLHQVPGKNATGVEVPPEIIERLGAGKKPAVRVTLNGFEFRTTLGVMAGTVMIPVSAAIREQASLAPGDPVEVVMLADASPREVNIPEDLALAFEDNQNAKQFFDTLSNSLQRYHIDSINGAKTAETRQRRIDKAIGLFIDKRQR